MAKYLKYRQGYIINYYTLWTPKAHKKRSPVMADSRAEAKEKFRIAMLESGIGPREYRIYYVEPVVITQ